MKNLIHTRYIFILLLTLSFFSTIAQNNYSNGFSEGYKNGYCYGKYGCVAPLPPPTPPALPGENFNSYQDGYNRGFQMGLDGRKGTNTRLYNPYNEIVTPPKYVPPVDLNLYAQSLMAKQELSEKRVEYIQKFIDYLIEIDNSYRICFESQIPPLKKHLDNLYKPRDGLADNSLYDNTCSALKQFESVALENQRKCQKNIDAEKSASSAYPTSTKKSVTVGDFFVAADANYKEANYSKAIENLTEGLKISPNNLDVLNSRAFIYSNFIHAYNLAIDDYTSIIQISPSTMAYYSRGNALYKSKRNVEAIKDFTNAILLDNNNTDAYFMRGLIKSELGDRKSAIADYSEVINNDDNKTGHNYRLGTVYNNKAYCLIELGRLDESLPLLNKALELDPEESYIWESRGEYYYKKGNYKACISDMTKSIEVMLAKTTKAGKSDSGLAYYLRGLAKIKLGLYSDGCKDLSSAGELGSAEAYVAIKNYCK
jgi:tetratricopeptide (TPR) repeat protein